MTAPYTPSTATATDTIPIVEDGEPVDALRVAPMAKRLADKTAFIAKAGSYAFDNQSGGGANEFHVFNAGDPEWYSGAAGGKVDFPDCVVGDLIHVSLQFNITVASASDGGFRLVAVDDYGGTAVEADVAGGFWFYSSGTVPDQIFIQGYHTVAVAGTCRVQLKMGTSPGFAGVGTVVKIVDIFALIAIRFPQ